jgi:hypothetical protein
VVHAPVHAPVTAPVHLCVFCVGSRRTEVTVPYVAQAWLADAGAQCALGTRACRLMFSRDA